MPDIHIEREHALGLPVARRIARRWVQQAEDQYGLTCDYAEGESTDTATFTRAGVDGRIEVTASRFELNAALGFLFGSFKDQIELKLEQNLDELLGTRKLAGGAPNKTKDAKDAKDDEDDGYNDKDWA